MSDLGSDDESFEAQEMYHVVLFALDDNIGVVPELWMDASKKSCSYPLKASDYMKSLTKMPKKDWKKYAIAEILSSKTSYKEAAKAAEDMSDQTETADEEHDRSAKGRKRFKKRDLRDDFIQNDDDLYLVPVSKKSKTNAKETVVNSGSSQTVPNTQQTNEEPIIEVKFTLFDFFINLN